MGRLRPRLRPTLMPSMATTAMAITLAMPTMDTAMVWDTTAIPMPTMPTMARGTLMLRLPPLLRPSLRLMLMLTMVSTDMAFPMPDMDTVLPTMDTDMPTTDTTDMPILMPTDTTTARAMLMLTTDTTDMPVLMPTDTTDMPVPTDTATPTD